MRPIRNDSIILLIIIVAIVAFLIGKGMRDDSATPVFPDDTIALGNDYRGNRYGSTRAHVYNNETRERPQRFAFDPNTADSMTLSKLGLREWQVRNILKYRRKGGRFRKPQDLERMYGMSPAEYKSLEPYIRIADDGTGNETVWKEEGERTTVDTMRYMVKMKEGETLELNSADTTDLKKVPGIGSKYAKAIVSYRDRLGGFVSVEQLKEVSGVPEKALAFFTIGKVEVRSIEVNRMSVDQLKKHPYLNFWQARSLVEHRRLHGPLRSVGEMRLLSDFTEKDIERLSPYVKF